MRLFSWLQILTLSTSLALLSACADTSKVPAIAPSPESETNQSPSSASSDSASSQKPAPAGSDQNTVAQETATEKEPETAAEAITVTGIKIIHIPTELTLGSPAVRLNAQAQLSDGSLNNGILFSVDNKEILKLEGDSHLSPVAIGKAHVTVRSLKDLSIKESIEVEVKAGSANSETGISPEEETQKLSLNSYYLDDYRLGMRWEYTIGLAGIKINTSGKPIPTTIPLAYGLNIQGATETNLLSLVHLLLEQQKEMGIWSLEVTAIDPENGSVTIRSQIESSSEYLQSQEPQETTYTPETIGSAFSDLMQLSAPEIRSVKHLKSDVLLSNTKTEEQTSADYFESKNALMSGPVDKELVSFWLNQEMGLVQKTVTIQKLSQGYLATDTGIQISLNSFSG